MTKNIVICSDGTGNAGSAIGGTNVWRIREAILASEKSNVEAAARAKVPGEPGGSLEQVVIYEDGVGTERFRPLAILGLAFSNGVTKDLESLYQRLMLVYEPGDRIYLFGFSRGAFTIRTLSYILYRCGLASPFEASAESKKDSGRVRRTHGEIEQIARDAVDAYKMRHIGRDAEFRRQFGIAAGDEHQPRWLDTSTYETLDDAERDGIGRVNIEFVGVWDTVSAVGLPFHNVTQFLFWFWRQLTSLWPLRCRVFRLLRFSLLNFRRPTNCFWTDWEDDLHPYIANAYQALALDDERETFYPVLWLEMQPCICNSADHSSDCHEVTGSRFRWGSVLKLFKRFRATPKKNINVEQVWFAGMHANVGGGYAKDHMSYVSLEWMMRHAANAGLAFEKSTWEEYRRQADPLGKMHDSRSGLGMYYRYHPRDVTWFSQDAGIGAAWEQPPLVHRTAFQRIEQSSQSYAPRGIPFAKEYVEVTDPPIPEQKKSKWSESFRSTWKLDSKTVANEDLHEKKSTDVECLEDKWEIAARNSGHVHANGDATRREAKQLVDLYVTLRKAAARWIVYMTVLIFVGASFPKVQAIASVIDRALFFGIANVYDALPALQGYPQVLWLPVAVFFGCAFLIVIAAMTSRRRQSVHRLLKSPAVIEPDRAINATTQPGMRAYWPYLRLTLRCAGVVILAFCLRPLLRIVVLALVPASLGMFLDSVFESPTLFSAACGAIFIVVSANTHYANQIEQWANFGWNGTRFSRAARPNGFLIWKRKYVEMMFSEEKRPGRYLGRFFTRLAYPLLSLTLLLTAVAYAAWLPTAEILTRMRISPEPPAPKSTFKLDASMITPTGMHLSRGQQYIATVQQDDHSVWMDGGILGNLRGIPWDERDAAARGVVVSVDDSPRRIATASMKAISFLTRHPDERYFQLCGAIGGVTELPFAVVPGVPFTASDSGRLYLFVNDIPGFYVNNEGTASVTVKRLEHLRPSP